MTEYDEASGDAFGLVAGIEPELGYFNLNALKSLGAQRLIQTALHMEKKVKYQKTSSKAIL